MQITNGYLVSKLEFRTDPSDYSTAVTPQEGMYYRDLYTKRIVVWDVTTNEFRDLSFFQGYRYTKQQGEDRIDSNRIYLARPGQRILGVINGIDEDSCSLTKNLNNTSELTFSVERIIDGEVTQYYEQIQRHYELYIPYHGWFKINEEPEIENDGTQETKSVRAESLEIELQQYDLVDFEINTGSEYSKEMLAVDNTYDNNGYNAFHDQVLFYRDTTALEDAIEEFSETDESVAALKDFITQKGTNYGCWRITMDDNNEWQIESKIDPQSDDSEYYTGMEILTTELHRQHELSFLWLVLHEHGWNVGFVDPYVDLESDIEDDRTPLANKVGFFEVDSQDIYSFLTQEAAAYYRCIFVFDTENYLVHAYNVNNIGYDTNIFLSFRNIQNEVTRTSDKDLRTVFHVQGDDDLDFSEANFGENQIEDISYFLTTDHFDQEFIDKYNAWQSFREEKRQEYMALSVQYRNQNDVVNELRYRVPADVADGSQYATMTEEELINEKANMRAMRYAFEHDVNYAQTDEHDQPIKDEDGNYIFDINKMMESVDWPMYSSLVNIVLSYPDNEEDEAIDHIVFVQGQESDEYEYDFATAYKTQYPNARLGQIDIALFNRRVVDGYYTDESLSQAENQKRTNVKNQKDFLDNYMFDFEHYGYLYGLDELQNFEKEYYGTLSALDDTGYNASDGSVYDRETYDKYLKYKNAYESVQAELSVRQQEVDDAEDALDAIVEQMDDIKSSVSMLDWVGDNDETFTEEELALIDKYYIHTDYTNQDIFTTSYSTNEEIIQIENQLYLDAMEQLYVESHPQYEWTTTQDNLLLMPEFHDWHGDLHVGNFVRISFRDDYQVKLRVSSITLNPLMLEPTIELQFTSMTQYKAKRNDFAAIIDSANASTKNSITSSISKKSGTDNQINVDSALILKLLNSSTFKGYMGSNNANITGQAVNAVSGNIETIATGVINAMDINVGRITGTQAQFDELFSNYIKSNLVVTKLIQAESADFEDLSADNAFVDYLNSGIIEAGTVTADTIIAGLADVTQEQISKFNVLAGSAFIDYLETNMVVASEIQVNDLKAKLAQVDTLAANSAFVNYLQTLSSTTAQATITDAYIYNAVAGHISVADLDTHTATASQIVLISDDNESPAIAFQNATQQFYDEDGNVRVQIGQDGNGDFNFIVRGTDGTTALFNENGITQNGVPNNTIINNMIVDSTIQKSKMGFPIVETNQDGTINIASIKDGSGGNFGVSYSTFTQNTSNAISNINDDIDEINSKKMYRVVIESNNGNIFKNGDINCTLSCRVYSWDDEITDDINAANFTWTRKSSNTASDTQWNANHSGGAKSITLTSSDVWGRSVFYCTVTLPDGSTVVGE